jgi:lysozyme
VDHLIQKEVFKSYPYNDTSGHATIGYGHKLHNGNVNDIDRVAYRGNLSQEKAFGIFEKDVRIASDAVNRSVKVPLTQGMHDALTSFTFNAGQGNLASSTLLKKLNKGDYESVSSELPRWNRSKGKVSNGLIKRRAEEVKMFYKEEADD